MTSAYAGRDPGGTPNAGPVPLKGQAFYPEWALIVAGAIAASALALVMHAFALAMGLSVSSAAPTWRDASFALVALSGTVCHLGRARLLLGLAAISLALWGSD